MYASRYERSKPNPVSLTAAIGINGALIAALLFSAPDIVKGFDPPMVVYPVHDDPPPPPQPPEPKTEPKATNDPMIVAPIPDILPPMPTDTPMTTTTEILPPTPYILPQPPQPMAEPAVPATPPTPAPVLTEAAPVRGVAFQPEYPPAERRAGTEGAVTVRVLVGADGRVKAVELVRSASDAFFEATRRYALSRWRFKPATRDGVPYESWRTMTVRFVLEE